MVIRAKATPRIIFSNSTERRTVEDPSGRFICRIEGIEGGAKRKGGESKLLAGKDQRGRGRAGTEKQRPRRF